MGNFFLKSERFKRYKRLLKQPLSRNGLALRSLEFKLACDFKHLSNP